MICSINYGLDQNNCTDFLTVRILYTDTRAVRDLKILNFHLHFHFNYLLLHPKSFNRKLIIFKNFKKFVLDSFV